ncbi:Uncharacterized protein Rs2_24107 [Raphanus sativus]|nr:Uncharacterized protein Rs2_24107 [Raphanus sativus]
MIFNEDDGIINGPRRERSYKVAIKFIALANMHHLGEFLAGVRNCRRTTVHKKLRDIENDILKSCKINETPFVEGKCEEASTSASASNTFTADVKEGERIHHADTTLLPSL